ncbi:hypothetical protein OJJOAM_000749 [Cupriavidus sp. H18C1]
MQAIEIREYGGPDVLQPTERPDPAPGPGEVLIRVAAAGVNRPDVFQRTGNYPVPPGGLRSARSRGRGRDRRRRSVASG